MRAILHVDLEAFFPSAEVREHQELKDKPLGVGADPKDGKSRGVVSIASYEARKFGIQISYALIQGVEALSGWRLSQTSLRPLCQGIQ
jgi:nucleotidyltransferase/DNA polymerase involved in DNA repair